MSRANPASADSSPGTGDRTSSSARAAPTAAPASTPTPRRPLGYGGADADVAMAVLYYALPQTIPGGYGALFARHRAQGSANGEETNGSIGSKTGGSGSGRARVRGAPDASPGAAL